MNAKLKKLAVTLAITTIFISLTLMNMNVAFSNGTEGKIDLFTQKEPYSGKGPNMPSDAFALGEVVILHALVTYSESPVQNLIVTFYVQCPDNSSFCLTARTNESGIAATSFVIPHNYENESEVFGKWLALANVLIDGDFFKDTLTFRVDWVVRLVSVRTINENLTHCTSFGKGGNVGLEITLRSVAMIIRKATLAIVIQDELDVPVSFSEIDNLEVQPNEKLVSIFVTSYIPRWAYVGNATVFISALTAPANQNGIAYCPLVYTNFLITQNNPSSIAFDDVAIVEVLPSANSVELGQLVNVSVLVQNEGTKTESFSVSAHCDYLSIGTLNVTSLAPYSQATLDFTLDTSLLYPGNYTITVFIPHLPNEADITDNYLADGVIEIEPNPPIVQHYFLEVSTEPADVTTILGEGWYEEYANVSLTAPKSISVSTVARYTFAYWDIDDTAQDIGNNSIIIFMDNNHTATAHYISQYYLTVRTDPPGITTIQGEGWYNKSTNVMLTAPQATNYEFSYWDINGVSQGQYANPIIINMNTPYTATAHYTQIIQIIEYTLIITTTTGGTTNPEPGTYTYAAGSTIQVNAILGPDYIFGRWELDGTNVSSATSYTVLMNKNHALKAVFAPAPTGWFAPDWFMFWFYWFLLPLLILTIILLIILVYRRKKKKAEEAFYSGWTAWYYCYDLRKKIRRS